LVKEVVRVRRSLLRSPWIAVLVLVALTTAAGFWLLAVSESGNDVRRELGVSLIGSSIIGLVFALVGQIIETGNQRRAFVMALSEKRDLAGIDLSGRDLRGLYLVDKVLSRADLGGD
jgi:uncharacterized membrane protein